MNIVKDSLLDELLTRIDSGRLTAEQALAQYPQYAAELRPLLSIVARLRAAPRPALSARASSRIEQQLLARASQMHRRPHPWPSPSNFLATRWATAALISLAVIVMIVGAGMATASSALPGEPLYKVKQITEQAQLLMTPADSVAEVHLELAQRRLGEIETLAKRGVADDKTLQTLQAETWAAINDATALPPAAQAKLLERVVALTTHQETVLSTSLAQVPQMTPDRLAQVLDTTARSHQLALSALSSVSTPTAPVEVTPTPTIPTTTAMAPVPTTTATPPLASPTTDPNTATPLPESTSACTEADCAQKPVTSLTPVPQEDTPAPGATPPGQIKTPSPQGTPGGPHADDPNDKGKGKDKGEKK
jgi:hypothetical protein